MRPISLSSIVIAFLLVTPRPVFAQSEGEADIDLFGTPAPLEESEKPKKPAKKKKKPKKEKIPEPDTADPFAATVEETPKAESLDATVPPESTEGMGKTEATEKIDGLEKTESLEKTEPQESLEGEKRKSRKGKKKGKKAKKAAEVTDAEMAEPTEMVAGPKALEGTTAYLGLGKVKLSGDISKIVSGAYEYTLEATRYRVVKNGFGIGFGAGYRYAKGEKNAVAPSLTSITAKVKHEQHNADAHVGINYTVAGGFGLGMDVAGVMQLDSLLITMPSSSPFGDDYYVSYGIGMLSRFDLHYQFTKAIVRLNYSLETGRKQQSQTLYFNNKQIDINPAQSVIGLQIGFIL